MKRKRTPPIEKLTPKPPRQRRWRRGVLIGLAIYAVLGFLILPAIIKWQLRKQLPALTQRQAEVKQVQMNPFALSLTIRGLSLTETNGDAFAAFDEFYVNFELSSLFHWAWTFGEIRLVHPTANLIRLADGRFNFSNLLDTNAPAVTNPPAPPPPVLIQSLFVTNAVVTVTDHTTPQTFRTSYGPINVALTDFNTHREQEEPYSFVATTGEGETFSWAGRFSLSQLRSRGQFKLTGIPPAKYGPYLAQFSTVQVQRGTLDIGATYRVNAARVPLELDVTNATVELRDFVVKPPAGDTPLLAIDRFQVANTTASLTGRVARVGLIDLNGGSVFIGRETNGQPTVLSYLIPHTNKLVAAGAPASNPQTTNAISARSWQFNLDEFVITNFNVAVEDRSTLGVAELGLDKLALNLKGLSSQSNAPIDLTVGFDWRGGGVLRMETRGTLLPPDLTTKLAISNLAIAPVQPYLGQHLNVVVHSGGVNVAGTAKLSPAATPQVQFAGDVSVTNFSSSDTIAYHELSTWEDFSIRGIDFSFKTNRLAIEEIKFVGARNSLVISSNGQLSVAALIKSPVATNDTVVAAPASAPAIEPFPIRVGALVFERCSFRAADDSLLRRFETHVEEFNGGIRDIVLPGLNKASVDIRGKVSSLAPFEITGSVTPDPQNLFVDLKVAFTNTDLTSLSPYMEKFVGRPLTKGKLTSEQRVHIENQTLVAANVIDLAQLTLGARVESPDATKLPVKLAIGLLKDMDGHILLDVPISGRTDDPQFSIWGLVGQTFKNLILKVAASPFSLLGALAGGGEELQFVDFTPGLATLNDSQTNKLAQLATALTKRPALSLEIGATFDPALDVDSLGRRKVATRMKTMRIEEIVARGKPAPALSEVQLEDGDYDRLLRKAYRTAFNTTPEQALYEALAAALATNKVGQSEAPTPTATSRESQKGATVLLGFNKSLAQMAAATRGSATGTNSVTSAKPKSEKELVRDELEQRLATLAPVTSDELRTLMQQRIETVQRFLVESAGIAADRVLPTTPNPEDPNRRGSARVVFSLD
jgi:hypothetical protein